MAKISCPWCWMNAECRRPSPSLESDPIDFPLCSATILPISCGPGNGNSIPVRARQFFALFHQEIGRTERADSLWIDMSVGSTCLAAIWSWRLSSFSCFSYVTWWDAQQNATPINHWQLPLWPPNLIPFQHLKKIFSLCTRACVVGIWMKHLRPEWHWRFLLSGQIPPSFLLLPSLPCFEASSSNGEIHRPEALAQLGRLCARVACSTRYAVVATGRG